MLKMRTEWILLISIRHMQERIIYDYALLAHVEVRHLTPPCSQGKKLRGFLMKCSSPTLKMLAKVPSVLSVSLVFREAIVIHFFQPFFRVRTNYSLPCTQNSQTEPGLNQKEYIFVISFKAKEDFLSPCGIFRLNWRWLSCCGEDPGNETRDTTCDSGTDWDRARDI